MVYKSFRSKRGGSARSTCPTFKSSDICATKSHCKWNAKKGKCYKKSVNAAGANSHCPKLDEAGCAVDVSCVWNAANKKTKCRKRPVRMGAVNRSRTAKKVKSSSMRKSPSPVAAAASPKRVSPKSVTTDIKPGDNVSQQKLMKRDFSGAKLSNVNFKETMLSDSNFKGADLRGAKFRVAILEGVDFTGADLTDADFFACYCNNKTIFTGAKFGNAPDFEKAHLSGAEFKNITFKNANFFNTNCEKTNFSGSTFEGKDSVFDLANFVDAIMKDVKFKNGVVLGDNSADFNDYYTSPRMKRVKKGMEWVSVRVGPERKYKIPFNFADLTNADFSNIDVSFCDFEGANLTNVKFVNSKLKGCNFKDAILTNTDFTNADREEEEEEDEEDEE